jgi:hypothetical protein
VARRIGAKLHNFARRVLEVAVARGDVDAVGAYGHREGLHTESVALPVR